MSLEPGRLSDLYSSYGVSLVAVHFVKQHVMLKHYSPLCHYRITTTTEADYNMRIHKSDLIMFKLQWDVSLKDSTALVYFVSQARPGSCFLQVKKCKNEERAICKHYMVMLVTLSKLWCYRGGKHHNIQPLVCGVIITRPNNNLYTFLAKFYYLGNLSPIYIPSYNSN